MAENYCNSCGMANREGAKFCARCGARLEVHPPPPPPPPPPP
ncbi:MAG: zinc-ribbon domain-containing protein, partial [Anaerolineales bacterium]|nr:zinc-ribbon domain-containing protein [Anaerolineales bacterium]